MGSIMNAQDVGRRREGNPDIWNAANNSEKVSANVLFNESVYPVEIDGRMLVVVEVPRAERSVRPVYVGNTPEVKVKKTGSEDEKRRK